MPRRRPLHRYPHEYYELFEKANRAPFSLDFDNTSRATRVRGELYYLRAAVRDAVALDPSESSLAEQYILMEPIVISQQNERLHFRKRNYVNLEPIRKATSILDAFKKEPSCTNQPGESDSEVNTSTANDSRE